MKSEFVKMLVFMTLMAVFQSCDNIAKNALESATENIIPATDNIKKAASEIKDATGNVKDVSENIEAAIGELRSAIGDLEESGNSLIGTAGDEMQDVINEFSGSAESTINLIRNSGVNIIKESELSALRVLGSMTHSARSLLTETDNMIRGNLKCIDEITAKRIAQITDSSYLIIDKLNDLIKETIYTTSKEVQKVMMVGGEVVSMTIGKTIYSLVSFLLLILSIAFLGAIAYLFAYKISNYSNKFKKILAPGTCLMISLICLFFFLKPAFLWSKLGYVIKVPNHDIETCEKVIENYMLFIKTYNAFPEEESKYYELGLIANESIDKCCLRNPNEMDIESKRKLADNIESILFPPPPPPSVDVQYSDCGGDSKKKSYHPRLFSNKTESKTMVLGQMKFGKVIDLIPYENMILGEINDVSPVVAKSTYTNAYSKALELDNIKFKKSPQQYLQHATEVGVMKKNKINEQ